jgi:cellulose synthase/poly-beta-1,6-N-acetylglucosamine synthase-like glycosyltransferase
MAVRNGERWIREKLDCILALRYLHECLQVVVVSDGSGDGTDGIVREYAASGVELVRVPAGGKAMALNAGMERARGEILFFTDVRQHLEPDSLSRLVSCFADPSVGVVSGELVITKGHGSVKETHTGLYWRYEKFIRKQLSQIDSIPGATGCIYAIRAELARPIPAGTLLDDVYLPMVAFFRGYRVIIDETARAYDAPTGLDVEFRRKVRTLAGVYQVIGQFPGLLSPWSNRMWIHFVSHKLGRLLLPFALALIFASSFGLPKPFGAVALAAQAVFYAMGAVDRWIPEPTPIKRLSSVVCTFLALMAASAWAASILLRPSKDFWTAPTGAPRRD